MHGLPVDADAGPPLGLPLRFFLTGLGFLIAALLVGVLDAAGLAPGLAALAHVHLLLAGWVCLTILGAMTQFVPTWSGGALHWRRLIELSFPLVAIGIGGLALGFALQALWLLPAAGLLAALGFWLFVAAMARTLLAVRPWDVTEAHFALAIAFLALVPLLGLLLAFDFTDGILAAWQLDHDRVVGAHATLAVFGVVLTTILGALVQLATMFTQTELDRSDELLLRVEQAVYPLGVLLFAIGRTLAAPLVARSGIVLLSLGMVVFAVVLARLLVGATVDYTPMHPRYGVVALTLLAWPLVGGVAAFESPIARETLLGGPGGRPLLLTGIIAFTVLGTLYHVVPFLVWIDRYADRVGLEPVPMIDDLYVSRIATVDLALTTGGLALLVAGGLLAESTFVLGGWLLFLLGALLVVGNLVGVVIRHVVWADDGTAGVAPTDD